VLIEKSLIRYLPMLLQLLPEFCTILTKSRAKNFLHGQNGLYYQWVATTLKHMALNVPIFLGLQDVA